MWYRRIAVPSSAGCSSGCLRALQSQRRSVIAQEASDFRHHHSVIYSLVYGIESRWGRDFPHMSRPAMGPTQPPIQWIPGIFPWVKRSGRGVDPHPPLSGSEVKESVELYLYPPSGPSWPVLGWTLRFTLPVLVVLAVVRLSLGQVLSSSTSVFPFRHYSTAASCSSVTDTMKS